MAELLLIGGAIGGLIYVLSKNPPSGSGEVVSQTGNVSNSLINAENHVAIPTAGTRGSGGTPSTHITPIQTPKEQSNVAPPLPQPVSVMEIVQGKGSTMHVDRHKEILNRIHGMETDYRDSICKTIPRQVYNEWAVKVGGSEKFTVDNIKNMGDEISQRFFRCIDESLTKNNGAIESLPIQELNAQGGAAVLANTNNITANNAATSTVQVATAVAAVAPPPALTTFQIQQQQKQKDLLEFVVYKESVASPGCKHIPRQIYDKWVATLTPTYMTSIDIERKKIVAELASCHSKEASALGF